MQHFKTQDTKDRTKPKVTLKQAFSTIIWPRRKLVFIGLILIVIKSLSGLILPWQSKVLLDDVVPSGSTKDLWVLITIVIIAITVQAVTSFLLTKILSVQAQYLISELRAQVKKRCCHYQLVFLIIQNLEHWYLGL